MALENVSDRDYRVNRDAEAQALLAEAGWLSDSVTGLTLFPNCPGLRTQLAEIARRQGHSGLAQALDDRASALHRQLQLQTPSEPYGARVLNKVP